MLASRGEPMVEVPSPSLSHGDDMVVEGVVVWKMPQPSLALEAVIASDPWLVQPWQLHRFFV